MPEFVIILIAMFLVAAVINVTSGADAKAASMGSYELSRVRVRIRGKVIAFSQGDDKKSKPLYIIVGEPKKKKDSFGKPKEYKVSRIDYAQMDKNTEVELLFDKMGKYEAFRLIKSNVPVS